MNDCDPFPRRSARLAALVPSGNSGHTSRALKGQMGIRKFHLMQEFAVVKTIPYIRWEDFGYDHQTSENFAALTENLDSCVRSLQEERHFQDRGVSLSVTSSKNAMLASDLDQVLPHDDLLLPHWKAFSHALMNFNEDYHTLFLGFCLVQLDRSVLELLFPAKALGCARGLPTWQTVTSLYFLGNHLGRNELLLISDVIGDIPTLEAFAICRNEIGDQKEDVLIRLSNSIRYHPNLERLALASCGIGNNKTLLSSIRNVSLKSIDLGSNGIGGKGAYYIAKFLAKAKNRRVAKLSLEDNRFSDKDAILFASALKTNKTISLLDLRRNYITDKGKWMLTKALYDDSSLNSLADSNHTALVKLNSDKVIVSLNKGEVSGVIESLNNPKIPEYYGKKSKLHSKLCSPSIGFSNLRYLEDVPAELVPDVLQLIQYKPGNQRATHTLVFHFLRAMP